MITVNRAIEILNRKFPGRTVSRACKYKNGYLFIAPMASIGIGDMDDPFFIVDSKTGSVTRINPTPYLKDIGEAMRANEIHISGRGDRY